VAVRMAVLFLVWGGSGLEATTEAALKA
jgi:hypothetical protein